MGQLWRVGRISSPYRFSEISLDINSSDNAGNRFDVLADGVPYAATTPKGAYVETLQGFRPTTATRLAARNAQARFMTAGAVPRDWRLNRRMARLTLESPAPFLDVENSDTWPLLEEELAAELAQLGITNLDVSVIRGHRRTVTRLIARWAYLADDPDTGDPSYGGIRYLSKLGEHECWAIFDGTRFTPSGQSVIERNDPDYLAACTDLDLLAH